MDKDGYISNGELFQVLKMMVGNNLKDTQLQQIVDKTIINADKDGDGRISFEEFCAVSRSFPVGRCDTFAEGACYSEGKCPRGTKTFFCIGLAALGLALMFSLKQCQKGLKMFQVCYTTRKLDKATIFK